MQVCKQWYNCLIRHKRHINIEQMYSYRLDYYPDAINHLEEINLPKSMQIMFSNCYGKISFDIPFDYMSSELYLLMMWRRRDAIPWAISSFQSFLNNIKHKKDDKFIIFDDSHLRDNLPDMAICCGTIVLKSFHYDASTNYFHINSNGQSIKILINSDLIKFLYEFADVVEFVKNKYIGNE